MLRFLKERAEEVASMTTLLTIAERAGDDRFDIETYLAGEVVGDAGAPTAAGAVDAADVELRRLAVAVLRLLQSEVPHVCAAFGSADCPTPPARQRRRCSGKAERRSLLL